MTESPFLSGTNIQYAWDSTSIGYLKTCGRLYQYIMVEGWSPKDDSVHLRFGQEYHQAIQDYDTLRATGEPFESAVRKVVWELLARTHGWDVDESTKAGGYKNRKTLLSLVVDYLDNYRDDPAETFILQNGKPAVELSFRFELDWGPKAAQTLTYHDSGSEYKMDLRPGAINIVNPDTGNGVITQNQNQPYLLCGHLDRVVSYADALFVLDHKAQPLSTSVLGQHGWIEIGQLSIGDKIAGQDGKFYNVKGLYPKGKTKVYRVAFNDNTQVFCGEDHLWSVADQTGHKWQTLSVEQMLNKKYYVKYHVPLVNPIQHPEVDLPIDPYVLGALLGDGYLNGNSIVMSTTKQWLADKIISRLPDNETMKKAKADNNDWIISGGSTLNSIRDLGLWKSLARTKFIPDEYLFASELQRRELLDGLLDTDGCLDRSYQLYDSMSKDLIEGICSLVRSLGGTARYRSRSGNCYRANLRLPEWEIGVGRRYITDIDEIDNEETMCIEVDSPDHLYVTENHTVTHNTTTTSPGSYFFAGFDPNNQMTLYTIAGQVVIESPIRGVIVEAAQILLDKPNRFVRDITSRTQDRLDEWIHDLGYWFSLAEHYATEDYWPQNDTACDKFGGCKFRDVCSKSPHVRETYLKADFVKLPPERRWNPLAVR